jgi:uncharacterized protein YndB with AHSA1/START domain
MQLEAKVDIGIARMSREVFDAIVDPDKMSRYFISRSSGRPEPGKTLTWYFDDVSAEVEVKVVEVVQDQRLAFTWGASGQEKRVTIDVAADSLGATAVNVTEGTWESDEEGIRAYGEQIQGWTSFLCCLKASVEHSVNLRKDSITRRHKELIAAGPAAKR